MIDAVEEIPHGDLEIVTGEKNEETLGDMIVEIGIEITGREDQITREIIGITHQGISQFYSYFQILYSLTPKKNVAKYEKMK